MKKKLLMLVLACAVGVGLAFADVNISIPTNANQDAKLARILAQVNAERAANNESTFATVDDYFRHVMIEAAQSALARDSAEDEAEVLAAYQAANQATKNSIRTALGLATR